MVSEGGSALFVVEGGAARRRPVATGARGEGRIEVVSGLAAGDKVVVSGAALLSDGARVEAVEEPASAGGRKKMIRRAIERPVSTLLGALTVVVLGVFSLLRLPVSLLPALERPGPGDHRHGPGERPRGAAGAGHPAAGAAARRGPRGDRGPQLDRGRLRPRARSRASGRPTPTGCGSRPSAGSPGWRRRGSRWRSSWWPATPSRSSRSPSSAAASGAIGRRAHRLHPRGAGAGARPPGGGGEDRDAGPGAAPSGGPPARRGPGRPRAHPRGPGGAPEAGGRGGGRRPGAGRRGGAPPAGAGGRLLARRPARPAPPGSAGARACWATWPACRSRRCGTAASSASPAARGRWCASSALRRRTRSPSPPGCASGRRSWASGPPSGLRVQVVADRSAEVVAALRTMGLAALIGLALGVAVLRLMLGRWRPTLALAVAVPASMLATFSAFHLCGVPLDVVSLAGLALAAGMLVDSSIVVLEAIETARARGEAPDARGGGHEADRPAGGRGVPRHRRGLPAAGLSPGAGARLLRRPGVRHRRLAGRLAPLLADGDPGARPRPAGRRRAGADPRPRAPTCACSTAPSPGRRRRCWRRWRPRRWRCSPSPSSPASWCRTPRRATSWCATGSPPTSRPRRRGGWAGWSRRGPPPSLRPATQAGRLAWQSPESD